MGGTPMSTRELKRQHYLQIWTPIIHECKNSGMTVKSWCEEKNINEKQYYYWQRRVREAMLPSTVTDKEQVTSFVRMDDPVMAGKTSSFQPDMVINYGNLRMELSNTVAPDLLSQVMQVLHHA